MEKITLREFWGKLNARVRSKFLSEVSAKCQVSIDTVKAWMLGYRKPTGLKRDALLNFIKDIFNVEIIEEGGTK